MTTKLNLTIEEATAKKIKAYAAKRKTSVSKLTEEYFNKLTNSAKKKGGKSFVEKYAGTLKNHIPDINAAKDEYIKERYGL